jgi:hypothetical protein
MMLRCAAACVTVADTKTRRIALSIKALLEPSQRPAARPSKGASPRWMKAFRAFHEMEGSAAIPTKAATVCSGQDGKVGETSQYQNAATLVATR